MITSRSSNQTVCFTFEEKFLEKPVTDLILNMEALMGQRPQPEAVRVLINSSGGKATFGILLYHYFRFYPLELTVVNTGAVESAASVAFLGAKHRMAIDGSFFMIHRVIPDPEVYKDCTPEEKERCHELMRIQEKSIEAIYAEHLKLSPNEMKDWQESQCDILFERAMSCGFVTASYSTES